MARAPAPDEPLCVLTPEAPDARMLWVAAGVSAAASTIHCSSRAALAPGTVWGLQAQTANTQNQAAAHECWL
jgi:hypothetical protein